MTTPGGQFPVITPQGEVEWWVIDQYAGGVSTRFAAPRYIIVHTYGSKPQNAVAGPFATQADAQAWINNTVQGGHISIPDPFSTFFGNLAAMGKFFHSLTERSTWIRVGEFFAGFLLLYVGLKALFPRQVNNVTSTVRQTAKKSAEGVAALTF